MEKKNHQKSFWDRYANLYDFEIKHFNRGAYPEIICLMASSLTAGMDVLEVATGTGAIALGIADQVRQVEAIDYSSKMIETAKKKKVPSNVHFSVENALDLPFADASFDAVVISNALHVIPEPAKVLSGLARVLKPHGLLIAPNYAHGNVRKSSGGVNGLILKLVGFEMASRWTAEEYVAFIAENGFAVEHHRVLNAAFPLVYLTARKV